MKTLFPVLLLCLFSLASQAQEANGPCRTDVEKYCRQSQGDPKAAMDCLLDHQQDISDGCYDNLKQRMGDKENGPAAGGPARKACKQDVEAFCKGIHPGGGRIVNCLKDHQKDLSDACYDQLSKRAKRN
jgi:hypothetical protein